jgi:hypothetical protein
VEDVAAEDGEEDRLEELELDVDEDPTELLEEVDNEELDIVETDDTDVEELDETELDVAVDTDELVDRELLVDTDTEVEVDRLDTELVVLVLLLTDELDTRPVKFWYNVKPLGPPQISPELPPPTRSLLAISLSQRIRA